MELDNNEYMKELRDEARANLVEAERLVKEGDVEGGKRAIEDAQVKSQSATDLENAETQIKALKGEFNKPTNAIPVTTEEAKIYNPNDKGKDYKTSYRPATWLKDYHLLFSLNGFEIKWVRMRKQKKMFIKKHLLWLRDPSPNAGHFGLKLVQMK